MEKKEVGHTFLARLGKKRLRPGGVIATNWLVEQGQIKPDTKVLEVACNMCTTSIELAKAYQCQITAVDMSSSALKKARQNIQKQQVEDKITIVQANAMKLPFEAETFDVIINEAMLTMLSQSAKEKAVAEYYRVLKKGGILLTHDIMVLKDEDVQVVASLRDTIHVNVAPLSLKRWESLYMQQGFSNVTNKHGSMSLLNPKGLIRDEGVLGTLKIIKNGLFKKENRVMFKKMYQFFNHPDVHLQYIALCSKK